MKNILLVILVIVSMLSCRYKSGSGEIVSRESNVGNFTEIDVSGGFEVEIKKGTTQKLRVEADDNIIDDIETRVEGNRLKIKLRDGFNLHDAHMKIFITAPSITSINSAASAQVETIDDLSAEETIRFKASSGSSIKAGLNAPAVTADASSGAQIDLSGRTKNFTVEGSSGSSVAADNLLSENTTAQTSSGATLDVHASVSLTAKASSGGSVNYRGAASVVKKESSGGSIDKKD